MQVDVTVEEYAPGWYQYNMYMCHSPRHGVEQSELCRSELNFSYAVVYFTKEFNWTYKLLPSENLCIRFAERLRSNGTIPYLCEIAKESS